MIELLVVVSLIVMLIALLVPALSRARESAKRSVCQANLHQIGTASVDYAASNGGKYPAGVTSGHWSFGGLTTVAGSATDPAAQALLYSLGYYSGEELMYCPSTKVGFGITSFHHWQPTNWNLTFTGYPYWGPYWQTGGALSGVLAFSPRAPGDTVLSADLCVSPSFWWKSNHIDPLSDEYVGGNVLYNNGRVSWTEGDQMLLRQSHAGQLFYF